MLLLLFNQPATTGVDGTATTSQGQSVSATASTTVTGTASTGQGQSVSATGAQSITGTGTTAQGQSVTATAATGAVVTGTATTGQAQTVAGTGANTAPIVYFDSINFVDTRRHMPRKPLLERLADARRVDIAPGEQVPPEAQSIEVEAAQIALGSGNEVKFNALLERWLGYKPATQDPYELFMSQVAQQVHALQQIQQQFDNDEDDALAVLLLSL